MTFENVKSRLLGLDGRLLEDEIYRIVWEEIECNELDPSAQARSIEEGAGDEGKTRSAYIKYRVRRLKDELELHSRDLERQKKQTITAPMAQPSTIKPSQTCSFCGAQLGVFRRKYQLCKDCSKKIQATKRIV
jgi:ribosomal protein S14